MEKLTYTVPEAAAAIGVHPQTVYSLIHKEGFPVVWVGRLARIPVDGLKRWIEQQSGTEAK